MTNRLGIWYTLLLRRLDLLRRSRNTVRLTAGALWFSSAALLAILVAILLELLAPMGPSARTVIALALAGAWVVLFSFFLAVPLLRRAGVLPRESDDDLARLVGAAFPDIRDRLLNVLQLHEDEGGLTPRYSQELIDAAGEQLTTESEDLDFTAAVDRTPVRRARLALFSALAVVAISAGLFPDSFPRAMGRLLHFDQSFLPPGAVTFSFDGATEQVLKGATFSTTIRVRPLSEGTVLDPRAPLTFLWKPDGQAAPDLLSLLPDSAGCYRVTIANVRRNSVYSARFGDFDSDLRRLRVLDPPALRSFRVRLDYPSYTRLPARFQEEFVGDITALPGTRVTLTGLSSNDLASAELRFADGSSLPATLDGRSFSVRFPIMSATSYLLTLKDTRGLDLPDPITYSILLIDDTFPTVELLQPGRDLDIAGDETLPMLVRISDDYGFSSLRLVYRLIHSRYEQPWPEERSISIPLPPGDGTTRDVSFPWSLDPLDLVPEDVVEYAVEVFDNDRVRGPKSARTPLFRLRLPSLDEVFADADETQRLSADELHKALMQAEDLQETIEGIEQDMKQNKPLDWQQQKTLEEASKKYQDIQQSIASVQQELAELVSSMQQQQTLSPETLEKYLELQQLFEQLGSPELQDALQQLQQAMQNVNRQQLQDAMRQLMLSEDRFRAGIERTINLLKRIQIEQKLDEALRRAEDLRERQAELARTTADSLGPSDREALARQQEDLQRSQGEFEASTKDVQERMEEFFAEMPLDRMEDVNKQLEQQQLAQQMQRSAAQLRAGQPRASQQTQNQIVNQLSDLSDDLQAIQEQLLQQQSQYTMNALRQATQNLLELSRRQEGLKNESAGSQSNSPGMRQSAQDQKRTMEDLNRVAQRLAELGQRSFAVTPQMARSIGQALQAMQSALQSLDARNGQAASRSQAEAMGALNSSAMAVQDALDAMMQGGSGGGMGGLMQQLQALAGQQQSLNARTQSMEAAAQAARLAAEQAAIQKSLEQLNREAELAGQGERLLGDLERVAQEMSEVVRSLEQQNVNPETIQRQERILSRLLDASHSLRERDFEQRRKATTGSPVARTSPPTLDESLQKGRDRLRQDLLRALEQGYSKEYEELIRKYFEELQREKP